MRFEWDEEKNRRNKAKHEIPFELACEVFGDPLAAGVRDRVVAGEERWQTIGSVNGLLLLVVHTYRLRGGEDDIRIISARKANRRERKIYEEGTEFGC